MSQCHRFFFWKIDCLGHSLIAPPLNSATV